MKILINLSVVSRNHRGMGIFTKQIIKVLINNKNHEYIFVSGNDIDEEIYNLILKNNYIYHQINNSLPIFEQIILPFLIFKYKPDICWFPSNTFPIIKMSMSKYIATIHDLIFFDKSIKPKNLYQKIGQLYRKYIILFGIKKLDMVTSVSESSLKEIYNFFKLNSFDKKYVLYNNFNPIIEKDTNILEKLNVYKDEYFYSIAGTAPHKNLDFLVNSFLNFCNYNNNYKLIISGASNSLYKNKYQNIMFTEYILEEEKVELIKNAKVFIFPSLLEGFGIPLIEGLYYNQNVLVSDIEIFREIGQEYVNYFNPYNINFLIDYFREKKDKSNNDKSKLYIRSSFCLENTVKKLEELFNEFK